MSAFLSRRDFSVVLALALLAGSSQAFAGELDARFSTNDQSSTMTVDHSAWDTLLEKYVMPSPDGINRFAYSAVTAADKQALKAYLARLQDTKVTALNSDEQRAFWINLYNALTIDVVLDHYPVKSIRDVRLGFSLLGGPWGKSLVAVEGNELSLNNIEHDILRKIWHDPRVHYAVNCASLSCPNLMAKAFTGATLDAMLTRGAHAYVNHPRGVQVSGNKARLSSIYSWYARDFGANQAALIAHLQQYASPELNAQFSKVDTISGYDYEWSLNDAN